MAFIRQIDPGDSEGRLKRIYDAAIERAGSVANIIQVMSLDAPSTEASMRFYSAIMTAPNALPRAQKEMLAAVVSNVNECFY